MSEAVVWDVGAACPWTDVISGTGEQVPCSREAGHSGGHSPVIYE